MSLSLCFGGIVVVLALVTIVILAWLVQAVRHDEF